MSYAKTGPEFLDRGRKEIQAHLILEDPRETLLEGLSGSDAVLLAMTIGENLALIGEPGGGKSALSGESYRLVDGLAFEDVTKVPHTADLTSERLIGATATTVKTTEFAGETTTEKISAELKPLLVPETKAIWLDEVNRVNPFAVNGVLGALENGKVITDAGVLALEGLEWAISTMNPHNTSQATFELDGATVSRHSIGFVMGDDKSHEDYEVPDPIIDGILSNWEPKPEKVTPIIDLPGLRALREQAKGILIAENDRPLARKYISRMLTTWREKGVGEAKGRASLHYVKVARGLGLLRNSSPMVAKEDLRDAALLVSCGRLAMGARLEYDELRSTLAEIVSVS